LRPPRLLDQLHLFVRVAALLRQLERHEPVHVRVREVEDQLALLALATPFPGLDPGLFPGSFADERLRQPERQALLPDTGRALRRERLRQPAGGGGACQPVSDPLVAVRGGDGHGGNLVCGGKWGRCAKRNTLCANLLAPFPGTCASINDYGEERYN